MSSVAEKMTHCPGCQKPVLNGGQFWSHAEFHIRCPWCQTTLQITIEPKITARVVRPEDKPQPSPQPIPEQVSADSVTEFEPKPDTDTSLNLPTDKALKIVGYIYPEKPSQ